MRTSLYTYLLLIAGLLSGCGGCNDEMSIEEKLIGTWLIANSGQLQPYLDSKPQFRLLPVKNSKLTFYPNGTIRGWIEDVSYNPANPSVPSAVEIKESWQGTWQLLPDQTAIRVEGTPYERPLKVATASGKTSRTIQFINEMPIEFEDEQTLNITSEGARFQFKLVTRKIEE